MNKNNTIHLLEGQHYTNLTETALDVIRTERHHEGEPFGVFYFDFSGVVTQPDFDLQSYLQQQIASDFYKHEGALQWNYYLNFVLGKSAFKMFHDTPEAAKIEADRTFARKRIWEQDALNADLAHPFAMALESTKPLQDIASRWVAKLKDAGLERVTEPSAEYTQVVRDYLSGESKVRISHSKTPIAPVQNGRFIHSLYLDNYRKQPEQKHFEFATVNLFRGANGTGKTSLLEAIELCICGGNRRQADRRPVREKLRIQFVGQEQFERCPETNLMSYRARDLAWYGGYYRKGNQLYHNFGRFNFFDSDAAFQLSSATNGVEIINAINALLLGEFATTIEERMFQCQERFAREERELKLRVQKCRVEVGKALQQIEQLKTIKDTRDTLFRELKIKAEICRWKKLTPRFKLDDLTVLREVVEDSSTRLAQSISRLPWLAVISVEALSYEANQLHEAIKEIAKQKDLAKKNSEVLESYKAHMVEVEAELKILKRLWEYHVELDAFSLLGIREAVNEAKTKVTQLKEAVTLLSTVDIKKYKGSTVTLVEIANHQKTKITQNRRSLAKLKTRLVELQTRLGRINAVVEEIKGLGRRFCELSPHSTNCPLCGAYYEQLSSRILSLEVSAPVESAIRELTTEIAREQSTSVELQIAADNLTQLRQAAQVVFLPDQLMSSTTKSVVKSLGSLGEKLGEEKTKLNELIAKENRLKLAGFDEEELQDLFEVAIESYSNPRSKLLKKDGVQTLVTEKTKILTALRKEGREKEKAKKQFDVEICRIVKRLIKDTVVEDPEVELKRRDTLIADVLTELRNIQEKVVISTTEDISSIANRLGSFAKAVDRIYKALKGIEEKNALEQRVEASLAENRDELTRLEPQYKRAKTALKVLAELLGSDYKAAYLKQVIIEHKEKLSTIFSRIHSPHEFKDVNIDTNVLLERYTGLKSPVSEISTGQRAALALSIFLSLNSSVSTRAPWLLFDEPVVHVDDLNTLSFLDMLRDLVLLGNRQVFFATANTRIADLFVKKFDCLREDFREFILSRASG